MDPLVVFIVWLFVMESNKIAEFLLPRDIDNPLHVNINKLFLSLDLNNIVDKKIEKIMLDEIETITNYQKKNYSIESIITNSCELIMKEIYKSGLTDFIIKFKDGRTIQCLKGILSFIPFFDIQFNDLDDDNSITCEDDYDIVMNIIKILYYDYSGITNDNYCETLFLMDKYLMKDYFYVMINYGNERVTFDINISVIAKKLLEMKEYATLIRIKNLSQFILEEKLCNLKKETIDTFFVNFICIDYGENMFIFDDWMKIFREKEQLEVIFSTKRYELLNVAKVSYIDMIKKMIGIDKLNIGYDHFLCYVEHYKIYTQYDNLRRKYNICNIKDKNNLIGYDNVIHIKQCYPKIDYDICIRLSFMIDLNNIIDDYNYLKINFRKSYINVKVGSIILIKYDSKENDREYYKIMKLEKIVDNNIIPVDVIYVDDHNRYTNRYMITFDRPINENYDSFYLVESKCFDVKLDV